MSVSIASADCYGCCGTGRLLSRLGERITCLCVSQCQQCGVAIAWGHDEEHEPDYCRACADQCNDGCVRENYPGRE